MKLHTERQGSGPDVVLVHGWGMHAGVWSDVATRLARSFRVTTLDLPGHGQSPRQRYGLDQLADSLIEVTPKGAACLGWSLGALVVMDACRRAFKHIGKAVLVGATPRFVTAADWPHAMDPDVLRQFGADLKQNYERTLNIFLALQFGADETGRASLRHAREQIFARGRPDAEALHDGLQVLERTDLRSELARIVCPTLVVSGANDRLAWPHAGEYLARAIPGARYHKINSAGHAPFISHFESFMNIVEPFLLDGHPSG